MRLLFVALGALALLVLGILLAGGFQAGESAGTPDAIPRPTVPEGGPVATAGGPDAAGATLHGRTDAAPERAQAAPTSTLAGRVIDAATGEGVPGALVIAFARGGRLGSRGALSGKDGRYAMEGLTPGRWWLFVWHPLHLSPRLDALIRGDDAGTTHALADLDVPEGGGALPERVLSLAAARRIEGRVVDADGRPVAGARIRFEEGDWLDRIQETLGQPIWGWQRFVPLQSDADGRFVLACLPPSIGTMRLGAVGKDFVGRWSEPIALDAHLPTAEVTLHTVAAAAVSGRALRPGGEPAVAVEVAPSGSCEAAWDEAWAYDPVEDATAGNDGAWALEGLPPGPLELDAEWREPRLDAGTFAQADLSPGERRTGVEITVGDRYLLHGRLQDAAGGPLPGEVLQVRGQGTAELAIGDEDDAVREDLRTDEAGRFDLAVAIAGPFTIVHRFPDGTEPVLREGVVLPAEDLVLTSSASPRTVLELHVVDPDGAPVPRFFSTVACVRAERSRRYTSRFKDFESGLDGTARHTVLGVPPLWIDVTDPKDGDGRDLPLGGANRRLDALPPGGVVEVRLRPADEVSGRIVGPDGEPVPGVVATLVREHDGEREATPMPLDADGRYALRAGTMEADSLSVEVVAPPGYAAVTPFRPTLGDETEALVLERAGRLAGRLVTPDGPLRRAPDAPPVVVRVLWFASGDLAGGRVEATVDEEGRWSTDGVPVDRDLTTTLYPPPMGYQAPPDVHGLRAGDVDVEIRLEPGLSIAGTCRRVDATSPAFERCRVTAWGIDEGDPSFGFAQVAADGSFEIEGLAPGRYRLALFATDPLTTYAERDASAGDQNVDFLIPSCGSLRVDVGGLEEDEPCDVEVWIAGTTAMRAWDFYTHEARPFEIPFLPAGETYVVTASTIDGRVASVGGVRIGTVARLVLTRAFPLGGNLRRRSAPQEELEGVLLALNDSGTFSLPHVESGAFHSFGGVPPGRYELRYLAQDGAETVVARDVAAGTEDLELWLP